MKNQKKVHWSDKGEITGGILPLVFLVLLCRLLPSPVVRAIAAPVSFLYYLGVRFFASHVIVDCSEYQRRCIEYAAKHGEQINIKRIQVLKQIHSFAIAIVEKVQGWSGAVLLKSVKFQDDDVSDLMRNLEQKRGVVVITSHLGNAEMLRSLAELQRTNVKRPFSVITIGDKSNTVSFNALLGNVNPEYDMEMVTGDNITPSTVIHLQEKLSEGAMVVMAGDRTSSATKDRVITQEFFDTDAQFPYGVYFLSSLLKAPVYYIFALRPRDISLKLSYIMHVHKSTVSYECSRIERNGRIESQCREFASYLQLYCLEHPLQWYNFYDFWAKMPCQHTDGHSQRGKAV